MIRQLVYALFLVFPVKTLEPFLKARASPVSAIPKLQESPNFPLFVPFNTTVLVLIGIVDTWKNSHRRMPAMY